VLHVERRESWNHLSRKANFDYHLCRKLRQISLHVKRFDAFLHEISPSHQQAGQRTRLSA
jgi:hypothetical protein